mmetsp:Transcript_18488/g.42802  ORF Transcript_18488/g.42802 Transcript_18488/m.42802 type:complete len:89 (+) Transcript_18488:522-788(+)
MCWVSTNARQAIVLVSESLPPPQLYYRLEPTEHKKRRGGICVWNFAVVNTVEKSTCLLSSEDFVVIIIVGTNIVASRYLGVGRELECS